MLIFALSFVVTMIISLCFFKNKFWENRYLVLLIGAGVALVATLTTNFIVRGHLEKRIETIWTKPLYTFYMPDSIYSKNITNKNGLKQLSFIKNYAWYEKHNTSEFWKYTAKKQVPVSFILYTTDKKGKITYVGVFKNKLHQDYYYFDNVYFTSSGNDTLIYVQKRKLVYSVPPSNWITGISFPRIETAIVICVPPKEFVMIPDSLIKKLPF